MEKHEVTCKAEASKVELPLEENNPLIGYDLEKLLVSRDAKGEYLSPEWFLLLQGPDLAAMLPKVVVHPFRIISDPLKRNRKLMTGT